MSRLAAPWRRCQACGCTFAATICHTCKTPARVEVDEADTELEEVLVLVASAGVVRSSFTPPPLSPVA